MTSKPFAIWALFVGLGITFAGCSSTFTNLTSSRVAQNDSNIYTFSFEANLQEPDVVRDSLQAYITIDGKEYPMVRDRHGRPRFTFDYRMAPGQSDAKYYYRLDFETVDDNNIRRKVTRYSVYDGEEPHQVRIVNRYPIQIISSRGPVGSDVAIVGRGFSSFDRVIFGGEEVPTIFESPTSVRFSVPSLPADQSYEVALRTGAGDLSAGTFRIDGSTFSVLPESVQLAVGERQTLIVRIPFPAPETGLLVDSTTDIPDAIIMPEILVPPGARTVNVAIEGAASAQGTLFLEAPGFSELQVPVSVHE